MPQYLLTPGRIKVLQILAKEGGEIRDETGQATSYLMAQTGHRTTNALSGMLLKMEEDGLIARDTGGRRTFSIRLTDLGAQVAAEQGGSTAAVRSAQSHQGVVPAQSDAKLSLEGVDLDLLVGVLLIKKALVATQAQEASAGLKVRVDAAESQVAELEAQLRASQDEVSDLRALVKTLEHNNQVLAGQMDKVKKNPGTPIKDLISRTELRDLEKLMRALPVSRG